MPVKKGAMTLDGSEELISVGIKDNAEDAVSIIFEPNGDAIGRKPVSEIRRAVERINDPEIQRLALVNMSPFFCEEAVRGEPGS